MPKLPPVASRAGESDNHGGKFDTLSRAITYALLAEMNKSRSLRGNDRCDELLGSTSALKILLTSSLLFHVRQLVRALDTPLIRRAAISQETASEKSASVFKFEKGRRACDVSATLRHWQGQQTFAASESNWRLGYNVPSGGATVRLLTNLWFLDRCKCCHRAPPPERLLSVRDHRNGSWHLRD